MEKSEISHSAAKLGLFAFRTIGKAKLVGYYYASLVYAYLTMESEKTKTCAEGVMHVVAEKFQKWAIELPEKEMGEDGVEHNLCIAPAPVFSMQYINSARYLLGDNSLEAERLNERKENHVQFL